MARRRRPGKRRGVNYDGKALKGDGKALSGDREALRMTEGMEGNGEAPHIYMLKIVIEALKFDGEVLNIERC